ncbi:MBL fold metallo-hydrolase [Porphyrobacter algicida]|uniref:MBL fold metallo-hydrolase n=1 Tax=Qipengyuania algicida TaxID=1836209 RepID=A0A845AQV8_9SPHN|nr:MBL fold metallo-hydrolase [Qipengyuania algicida]MXP29298.1 MBL fold metallo-hydrolase [Qipengyuania algicida]
MKITFLGAAGEVTGSCYLVEAGGARFLVDCGMFQGGSDADSKNRRSFSFSPSSLDFVILSHAHIDHSGLLPKLCRDGFEGPIYTSKATAELLEIMLRDSAHIHEAAAERAARRRSHVKEELEPLYRMEDAETALSQVDGHDYDRTISLHPEVQLRLRDAGHILGSAILEIWIGKGSEKRKLVFSGDLGQPHRPILRDPVFIDEADYLIVESTYGNRDHEQLGPSLDRLVEVADHALNQKKGNLNIPAFAVGRTQELIYYFHHLTCEGRLKNLNIFLDSPMAQRATELTKRHIRLFDEEAKKLETWKRQTQPSILLKYTESVQESIALNTIKSGAIIISASGMCTEGRILHHLRHGLPNRNNTVLFAGYQAEGTRGRKLVDGAASVRIFGQNIAVRADVRSIGGFSAHADRTALLAWISAFKKAPKQIFVTHGEEDASSALQEELNRRIPGKAKRPKPNETAVLS